jgi:methionyl-tRNA formyltransferase
MRLAIIGQQDFGKAVLEAFLSRGDTVAGVFCAPEKPGARPDPLRIAAEQAGIRVCQLPSLKTAEARETLRSLNVELGVMAYVLQFVPQDFVTIPPHGMIQYHPSLLPRYRGPSAINWPIIRGDGHTGLSIFRPVDGLDEGPVILQKSTPVSAEDTLGSVYFERLFPLGVAALVEAAALVTAGRAIEVAQDESQASYEGWCRAAEAQVNWHNHVDLIHNLIRGCDPSPGAWTVFNGKKLQLFEARKHGYRKFSEVQGAIGAVSTLGERSVFISAHGGRIEVSKLRYEGGQKMAAPQFCAEAGLKLGTVLGT